MISVEQATKNYGNKKGIFGVNLSIHQGEVFGLLGPNGAGKTTTIRHLLGFSKLDKGSMTISGLDVWTYASVTKQQLGYLPGEISFPTNLTGRQLIQYLGELRGMKRFDKANALLSYFDIQAEQSLKSMSKGMKQKIGIVLAFMHNPSLIILDEPTSGLDPLMQDKFIQLVEKEKSEKKTILISSHMFNEIERTCDRVAIMKQGSILTQIEMKSIQYNAQAVYEIGFQSLKDFNDVMSDPQTFKLIKENIKELNAMVMIQRDQTQLFLEKLVKAKIKYLKEEPYTLEKYFMKFYGKEI